MKTIIIDVVVLALLFIVGYWITVYFIASTVSSVINKPIPTATATPTKLNTKLGLNTTVIYMVRY
jgi:hypothetical protein